MGRLRRFIVEYVGNLHFSRRTAPVPPPAPPPAAARDRRTNHYARELIDWIEGQMEARGFPTAKKRELVHDLRQAFRQGLSVEGGSSVSDATGEGTPEWVAGAKGVGRDAPS